jgi:DnaK suppressor protein
MGGIELEAREVLLRRRRSLCRGHTVASGDPEAFWTDYDTLLPPFPEEVRRELADIDQALQRIQQGRYGTCLACGGPMGLQRLRALPEARYCISCSGRRVSG